MARQHDAAIAERTVEEINRLFNGYDYFSRRTGINRRLVHEWQCGSNPSAISLARLHYAGADVIYILTGIRKLNIDTKPEP